MNNENYQWQRGLFHNNEKINSIIRRYNTPKHVWLTNITSKYIKQTLTELKGTIDNPIILWDFNTLFSVIDGTNGKKQQINSKDIEHLNLWVIVY